LPLLLCLLLTACGQSGPARPERIVIDLAAGPVARFSPDQAFGAVIDGLGKGRVDQVYTPGNIRAIKSAGFGSTAYNLRTELGIEAWHWTDEGTWSDAAHAQGYWTGSDHPRRPVWKASGDVLEIEPLSRSAVCPLARRRPMDRRRSGRQQACIRGSDRLGIALRQPLRGAILGGRR
jgi:hypothetical protein